MSDIIDAVYRSGISGQIRLSQAGQGGYAPLGFSNIKVFPDADQLFGAKATGTTVADVARLTLTTGVVTAQAGAPTLADSDGKTVNGDTIDCDTVYCYGWQKKRAGAVVEEATFYKGEAGAAAAGITVDVPLTVIGDIVEFFVIGKTDA